MSQENTIPETGIVFIGLARERLEATYEPLRLLDSVVQAFECSLVDDPQAAVLRKQISRVRSLINRTLQVLSAPMASAHKREDPHTALARTMAWIDFAGHPLQDMWGALMCIGKRTEQLQIELHRTVEELRMLDLQLGKLTSPRERNTAPTCNRIGQSSLMGPTSLANMRQSGYTILCLRRTYPMGLALE